MNKALSFFWEVMKIVIIAFLIVAPIRYFIFQPFLVKGSSMEPNFHNGDYLIIDEISYRFREPKRGEVVVFEYPKNTRSRYIKRIIGLPGETVEVKKGKVFVTSSKKEQVLKKDYIPENTSTPGNIEITLDSGEYFVLGDNRDASYDSRRWGALKREYIVGRVWLHLEPLDALAEVLPQSQ